MESITEISFDTLESVTKHHMTYKSQELMYISLIVSINSSLTHLHGFQLLVLLP